MEELRQENNKGENMEEGGRFFIHVQNRELCLEEWAFEQKFHLANPNIEKKN